MRRLLVVIMGVTTGVTVLAFVVPLSVFARGVETQLRVDAVVDAATSLAAFVDDDVSGADLRAGVRRFETEHGDLDVEVYDVAGEVVVGDRDPATDPEAVARALGGTRVVDRGTTGVSVYVPNNGPFGGGPSAYVVRVTATGDVVDLGLRRILLVVAGSAAVAMLLGGGVGLVAARTISEPTRDLTATARQLRDGRLDARVEPAGPAELRELGATLNHLAARIRDLLEHERETAADIAHRLRTPLTALGLEVESREEDEDVQALRERAQALQAALDGVIADLRGVHEPARRSVDVRDVARSRLADWQEVATATGRPLRVALHADVPCPVALDADAFEAAFDAVVGNAFTHTPVHAAVSVDVARDDRGVVRIRVDDAGPGWPDDAVLERGHSAGGSTGLGLDIAGRTADAAGGSLALGDSPLGGARVTMELPLLDA